MELGWEAVPGCWRSDKPPALLSSWTDCKAAEMHPRDQWTAKQMTWIRARVPMNFPWTKEGRWSMARSPVSAPPPHFPRSLPSQKEPSAVVVLKLKLLTRRCHGAVPLRCLPIMWDFWFERLQFIFQRVGSAPPRPLTSSGPRPLVWFILGSGSKQQSRWQVPKLLAFSFRFLLWMSSWLDSDLIFKWTAHKWMLLPLREHRLKVSRDELKAWCSIFYVKHCASYKCARGHWDKGFTIIWIKCWFLVFWWLQSLHVCTSPTGGSAVVHKEASLLCGEPQPPCSFRYTKESAEINLHTSVVSSKYFSNSHDLPVCFCLLLCCLLLVKNNAL